MEHFLSYLEVMNLSVCSLVKLIAKKKKKALSDLKLIDLIFDKKSLIGVYILFDNNDNPIYVGKTGSRAILERIASHLDLREDAFMNNFLCALTGKKKGKKNETATEKEILNVYDFAINCKILFIQIPEKKLINRVEKVLLDQIKPKLNNLTGVKAYNISDKICELL